MADVDASFQRALAAGAAMLAPVTDQYYGDRVGTVLNPFGNRWFIATRVETLSGGEMDRRTK